jgi:hypothetical protein
MAVVGYQQLDSCFIRLAKNPNTALSLDLYAILEAAVRDYPRTNFWGDADYAGFNGRGDVDEIIAAIIAVLQTAQKDQGSCRCTRPRQ